MEKKQCKRCGHKWYSRTEDPIECPKCKSYNWEKEKQNAQED